MNSTPVNVFNDVEVLLLDVLRCPERSFFADYKFGEELYLVCKGSYIEALRSDVFQSMLWRGSHWDQSSALSDFYRNNILTYLETDLYSTEEKHLAVFCIGVSCLQLFLQNNFCGPFVESDEHFLLPGLHAENLQSSRKSAVRELVLDMEEIYSSIEFPEYLLISRLVFFGLNNIISKYMSSSWWVLRCAMVHQRVGEEHSPSLYTYICHLMEANEADLRGGLNRDMSALYDLEMGHFYLYYQHVGKAKDYFDRSKTLLGLDFELTGALGKRTKWQENNIAQLILRVNYQDLTLANQDSEMLVCSELPKDVLLEDDTRLPKVKYAEADDEDSVPNLRPIEQMCLFSQLLLIKRSSSHDEQMIEVSKSYITALLNYPKCWALQLSALLHRCKVECRETRAMQRSLNQLEELVCCVKREKPSHFQRLSFIYSSAMVPRWELEQELARMFVRLGCIKSALEIFERLKLWDDVVECYNSLQMRQRSAKIVQQLMKEGETPKLWCMLGDATDDIECYEKAWELSGRKSSRAQRSQGMFYYSRKDYSRAIEHFETSLSINSLQFSVWQRLGFSALQNEDWETCAKAYRRCTALEPDSYESWNNLSQAYLKLNQLVRAWRTLQEALKGGSGSWQLWDNYMVVSSSLGHVSQALHAYSQILRYEKKHVDTAVLGRAVKYIVQNEGDSDARNLERLREKCIQLLAELTVAVPSAAELWFLYAELLESTPQINRETQQKAIQMYRKSIAAELQKTSWSRSAETCLLVMMRCLRLAEVVAELSKSDECAVRGVPGIGTLPMLYRTCVLSIRRSQTSVKTGEIIDDLKPCFDDLQQELSNIERLSIYIK